MDKEILKLAADLLSAYVTNNPVGPEELPGLIAATCNAFWLAAEADKPKHTRPPPMVPIRASVTADFIICLEDGKKLKSMTRYLRTRYNMTPDEYREKWGLPKTYPMVAPEYAEMRSAVAKKTGLGRNTPRNKTASTV